MYVLKHVNEQKQVCIQVSIQQIMLYHLSLMKVGGSMKSYGHIKLSYTAELHTVNCTS